MLTLCQHIQSRLEQTSELPADTSIRIWSDTDPSDENFVEKFPMITHIDLHNRPNNNQLALMQTSYQITAWATTLLQAKEISALVVQQMNRYHDAYIEACTLESITNSFDNTTKTHGVHCRFMIVTKEKK